MSDRDGQDDETPDLTASEIAHEINSPLTYLLTLLDEAARAATGLGKEAEDLRLLVGAASEAAIRIRDIVAEVRGPEADKGERRHVAISKVIADATQIAATELSGRARLSRIDRADPLVLADEGRLTRVFVNLLINAAQAMPPGRAGTITLTVAESDHQAVIEIQDDGIGIAPEDLPRVFDKFFSTKPADMGTGLGLPISRRIVRDHGGELILDSEPGRGTIARLTLPSTTQNDAARAEPAPQPATHVLVVDDEALVGRAIERVLARICPAISTTSAAEALRRLERGERFVAIITDVRMPGVSGVEFYQIVQARWPDQAARFIFTSGGELTREGRDIIDKSGRPFFEKPVDAPTIRRLIESLRSSSEP